MNRPNHTFALVWDVVRQVPRGKVVTYGQVSLLIGRRLTPVGVGWAMAAAPPDVPWQRVVNAKGAISSGNPEQRRLLEKERVRFDDQGCVVLSRHQWQREPPRATAQARRDRSR